MNKQRISQATLLSRGWTKSMISKLLPEPVLVANPYYKKASPMKLWELETVEHIEQSQLFSSEKEAADKRKANAQKAVGTRIRNFKALVKEIVETTEIKMLDDDTLRAEAINHARERSWRSWDDYEYGLDEYTISRWVVNYIRHTLIRCGYYGNYDNVLYGFKRKAGKEDAYIYCRNALLDKIAEAYPKHAQECADQKIPQ